MDNKQALAFLQNPIKDLTGVAEAIAVAIQVLEGSISDDLPILDGSEMIGEETVDEYLDRLVKEASPSWQGVDPQRFLDEVRGRNAGLEWKKGSPEEKGRYLVDATFFLQTGMINYDPEDEEWDTPKILWHIGPIPPVPQNDEE